MRLFSGAVLVAAIIAAVLAVRLHRGSSLIAGRQEGPADRAVIIIVDGAGPRDLINRNTPNISRLAKNGTTYPNAWLGQLEEDPAASSASIATGRFPVEHGIVGPGWTDSQTGQAATALQPQQVQLGSIDQVMESHAVSSIAQRIKSRAPADRVLAVGGAGCSGAAAAGTWLADYILCAARDGARWAPASVAGHRPPSGSLSDTSWSVPVARGTGLGPAVEGWRLGAQDDWVARYAISALRATRPALTVVEFPELALVMPYAPPDQRGAIRSRLVAGIDRGVGGIIAELRRERRLQRTVFVVTSSETVTPYNDTVPRSKINEALQAAGAGTLYFDSDGMAMLGMSDPVEGEPVAQAIQGEQLLTVDSIYYRTHRDSGWSYQAQYLDPELPSRFGDVAGYLLRTIASPQSPDVVVSYAPRVGTESRIGPYIRSAIVSGMQWENQHVPLILSGQGVFPGVVSQFPARLVEIAPTVEAMLGMDPAPSDGTVLADALYAPPGDALERQRDAGRKLQPLVTTLQQRSAAAAH